MTARCRGEAGTVTAFVAVFAVALIAVAGLVVDGGYMLAGRRAAFDEAEAAKQAGEERVILIGLSGHGHFDMSAYEAFLRGELTDLEFSQADMDAALERLPEAPVPS